MWASMKESFNIWKGSRRLCRLQMSELSLFLDTVACASLESAFIPRSIGLNKRRSKEWFSIVFLCSLLGFWSLKATHVV